MPIVLDTPLSTGDIDGSYDEVKIVEMRWLGERSTIRLIVEYGNTVNGTWVPGKAFTGAVNQNPKTHLIVDADYTAMVSTLSSAQGAPLYGEIKDALYDYLLNKGLYPGTIV